MFQPKIILTAAMLLSALPASAHGASGDTPSIYNKLITKAASRPPANWRTLTDQGDAQVIAFFMIDSSGNLINGPRIVSSGQPEALRKALEAMVRNDVIKAAPFKGAPNKKYSGKVLKFLATTCVFEKEPGCVLTLSVRLPDDVRAWKEQ